LEILGGEIWAKAIGSSSLGVSFRFVINRMRRTYMYIQTIKVKRSMAKKGLKIAFCCIGTYSPGDRRYLSLY
jgi:hypothetical protein